jgi:Flp pilus assembly pilin Flp
MVKHLPGEKGQGLFEYALIISLIAIGLIVALQAYGVDLGGIYNNILNELCGPFGFTCPG